MKTPPPPPAPLSRRDRTVCPVMTTEVHFQLGIQKWTSRRGDRSELPVRAGGGGGGGGGTSKLKGVPMPPLTSGGGQNNFRGQMPP